MNRKKWDAHFLRLALDNCRMSKDPNTQVGAVLVGSDMEVRSMGFNGFPRRIWDSPIRLRDRDTKNRLMVHAEMNAVLNAARGGIATRGTTLYLACTDATGAVWGGAPCTRCTVEIIQAGIRRVVSYPFKSQASRWADDVAYAECLLIEAGVEYIKVPLP